MAHHFEKVSMFTAKFIIDTKYRVSHARQNRVEAGFNWTMAMNRHNTFHLRRVTNTLCKVDKALAQAV